MLHFDYFWQTNEFLGALSDSHLSKQIGILMTKALSIFLLIKFYIFLQNVISYVKAVDVLMGKVGRLKIIFNTNANVHFNSR